MLKWEREMIKKLYSLTFVMLLLLIVLSVVTIPSVLATSQMIGTSTIQSLPPVKQYDCVILKQVCGNCSYINISSVSYPNSTQVLGEVIMNPDSTGTLYTYSFCNTSTLGPYTVTGFYDENGIKQTWNYPIEVTTTGQSNNFPMLLFLGLGGFIIFIIAIATRNLYIGFISGAVFMVLGVYIMIFGFGTSADFYTQSLSYVSLGFGMLIFLSAAYEAITDTGIHLWKKEGDEDEDF